MQNPISKFAKFALLLLALLSTNVTGLSGQLVNGHIVLARDGVDASDFDGVPFKVPFSTILNQSDEGPNFFIGYYRGKCITIERDSIVPIRTARDLVAELVSTHPTDDNWALLAKIEQHLRNLVPARDAADRALLLNPQNADALFVLAEVFFREGEYEMCREKCDEALTIAPDRAEFMARRAATLTHLVSNEDAIAAFEKVLEIDPLLTTAWSNLGTVWQTISDDQKAIDCFNKAVEIDPGFWHGWCCLAIIEGNTEKAIEHWERCFQCGPNTYTPFQFATDVYASRDDIAGYHRLTRMAVQFPDCPDYIKQSYAMTLATTSRDEFRDGQAALKILEEFTETDGREIEDIPFQLAIYLAAAYAETGNFEKAMQVLEAHSELESDEVASQMYESYENGDPWRVDD